MHKRIMNQSSQHASPVDQNWTDLQYELHNPLQISQAQFRNDLRVPDGSLCVAWHRVKYPERNAARQITSSAVRCI